MKNIYILLFIVMLLWGFNVSAIKVLVTNIDPILVTSVRIFVAGVAVLLICLFMGVFRWPSKKEWKVILYVGLFNVVLHHALISVGLKYTSGINSSLILGTGPLLTVLLAILLLKQRVPKMRLTGFVLGFIGIFLTTSSGGGFESIAVGDVVVFFAVLTQAFSFILIGKYHADFDSRLSTGFMLLIGSFFIFLTSLFFDHRVSDLTQLFSWKLGLVFLFSSLLCTAFGHIIYNFAIKQVGPAETTLFMNLNTLFAVIGSVLFLNESITLFHFIGFIFILCGIFVGTGTLEYVLLKRRGKLIDK
ncbi:DMT family transporter [Oceanobacillus jeddahense]|uniref:DMT family transporter n=1 Tax=Oceanobacillus jeddahense TaxID=1462527 RepID=A0ABY5JV55_9BACI|nr:DMT family transporter [Oceanobacillus jeddahense]UUI04233.1 DMT family transporter [Oceanobacillus jeddahense]